MFVCSVPPQIKVPGSSFEFLYPHRLGCKGLPGISWDIVHRKKYNVYHSWVWHTWLEKHFGCSIDSFLEGQVIRRDWFYLIWQQTVIGIGVIIIKHVRENFAAHCFSDGFFPVHAMKRTNRKRIMPGAPPTQPLLGPDQVKNKDTRTGCGSLGPLNLAVTSWINCGGGTIWTKLWFAEAVCWWTTFGLDGR